MMRALIIALVGLAIATPALAQSFNCSRAHAPDEITICHNPQLSAMDSLLAGTFSAVRVLSHDKQQLSANEGQWLTQRRACSSDANCVAKLYQSRLAELKRQLADATHATVQTKNKQANSPDATPALPAQQPNKQPECGDYSCLPKETKAYLDKLPSYVVTTVCQNNVCGEREFPNCTVWFDDSPGTADGFSSSGLFYSGCKFWRFTSRIGGGKLYPDTLVPDGVHPPHSLWTYFANTKEGNVCLYQDVRWSYGDHPAGSEIALALNANILDMLHWDQHTDYHGCLTGIVLIQKNLLPKCKPDDLTRELPKYFPKGSVTRLPKFAGYCNPDSPPSETESQPQAQLHNKPPKNYDPHDGDLGVTPKCALGDC